MKKNSLRFGLGITMLLAVVFNFISRDAAATDPVKIICYASSNASPGSTYTKCYHCGETANGTGSDQFTCGNID